MVRPEYVVTSCIEQKIPAWTTTASFISCRFWTKMMALMQRTSMTVVAVESQVVWVGCLVSECIDWPRNYTKLTCCLFGELLEVGIIPLRFSYVITCDILWYFLRILTATHASCFTVVFSLLLFLWKEIARIQRTFHKFDQDSKSPGVYWAWLRCILLAIECVWNGWMILRLTCHGHIYLIISFCESTWVWDYQHAPGKRFRGLSTSFSNHNNWSHQICLCISWFHLSAGRWSSSFVSILVDLWGR